MKLSVRFRKKYNIPFSIEQLSGTQYRCGVCGDVFLSRPELETHLKREKSVPGKQLKFPRLNENIDVRVLYSQDLHDRTNPEHPRLRKGDYIFHITSVRLLSL